MSVTVLLYAGYTIGSVAGLLILKTYLPLAKQAFDGIVVWNALAFVGVGAALYIASFLLWLAILSRSELSVAYPIAIGLTLCLTALAGWFILNEPVSALRIVGMSLIFLGIVVVTRS